MAEEKKEAFLHRWSRRKQEVEKEKEQLPAAEEKPLAPLPPVDKLTPESDFTGFMHPKVEDALRRTALKTLFRDPHFNTPDPYEPFSGDWTVGEPVSEELLATLNQAKQHVFNENKEQKEEPTQAAEESPTQTVAKPDEPGKQDA
jgi:Protein of unknown function (DUF3306)